MNEKPTLGQRWGAYRPTKAAWFWSSASAAALTMIVGFSWGGWVTGSTAQKMAADAAAGARTQLAAAACVARFNAGPSAAAELAALKGVSSYSRGDMLVKDGWATMAGGKEPVAGAADLCARMLVSAASPASTKG